MHFPAVVRQLHQGKLVRVCLEEGYVVSVVVAENDVSGRFQCFDNLPPDFYAGRNLTGMGKKAMPPVSQGNARVNENTPLAGGCQAAHAADTKGLAANYGCRHELHLFRALWLKNITIFIIRLQPLSLQCTVKYVS